MIIDKIYSQLDEQQGILVSLLNSPNPVSPTLITDVGVKLSILNGLLGSKLAGLKADQINKEKEIFATCIDEKMAVGRAEAEARFGSLKERKAYETAETRHKDMWKLISMSQTHIKANLEEQRNG